MKPTLLSLILLLYIFNSFSQTKEEGIQYQEANGIKKISPTRLVLKLGGGLPQNDFGDMDINNPEAGLAETGALFEVELFHQFSESIYFSLMGRFQANNTDSQPFANYVAQFYPSNYQIDVSTEAWKTNSFMAGIGTIAEIDTKTNLLTRFMIGISSVSSPGIRTNISDPTGTNLTVNQESNTTGAISYLAGLGLNLNISENLDINIIADYFGTTPEFENIIVTANGAPISSTSASGSTSSSSNPNSSGLSFEQEIRMVNLSIGFAFKL